MQSEQDDVAGLATPKGCNVPAATPAASPRGRGMHLSDFEQRLLERLQAKGKSAVGIGIDLGTTKSCLAYAAYDPVKRELRCECAPFEQSDGALRTALPSAVAVDGDHTWFGAEALAKRGQKGFRTEKNLFYDSKNEIGLRYTYANAPIGFKNAGEVASQLLNHMRQTVCLPTNEPLSPPVVVTVPASFHGAQRQATVRATRHAFQFDQRAGRVRLLDEPYAAFLDLKLREPERAAPLLREGRNLMVFDFGGGTCDVAIFRIDTARGGTLGARLLGTSRYHRLGGGDIDRAIVHDVLLPALLRENAMEKWEVSWFEKRRRLEPQLLSVAESLKIALSQQLAAPGAVLNASCVTAPALTFDAEIGGVVRTLRLAKPTIDAAAFASLMRPFLDPEPSPEAGDEYVQRSSIFSPIAQALFRAGLEPRDVEGVLLCGSSSLLPPVQQALARQFPDATQVLLGDAEALAGAVARGAALQALSLQVLGGPLIAPVCSAEVSLRVVSGCVPLTRPGDAVPARSSSPVLLRPPRDSRDAATDIAVEVIADGGRIVGRSLWQLPAPVSTQDRLTLDWRMDENQCVELKLSRVDDADTAPFVHRFDAPITHRDPGQIVRCRMLERCESIRRGDVPRAELGNAFVQIARDCGALGEYEKGLHFISLALQEEGDDLSVLNLRGIYREKIGNREGAMESYTQAWAWSAARFNLARLQNLAGQHEAALKTVDAALECDPQRAYRVLRGDILEKLGRSDQARVEWEDAIAGQPDWSQLQDYDLGWLERASKALNRDAMVETIRAERKRLAQHVKTGLREGELPEFVSQALHNPAEQV